MNIKMIGKTVAGLGLAAVMMGAQVASAAPIDISSDALGLVKGNPDYNALDLVFSYTAGETNNFSLDSMAGEYTLGASTSDVYGAFSISGSVNSSSADLTLSLIDHNGTSTEDDDSLLLSGELSAFSFDGGSYFYMIFDIIDGDYANDYGSQAGVIANVGYDFDYSQSGSNLATADTFSVPVSGTLSLALFGLAGLGFTRKQAK